MKNKSIFKSLLTGFAILAITTGLTSCKDNDEDETGTVNLKVVNASPGSTPQGFFLANSTVVSGGLAFGDASDYIVTNSGNNMEVQFRNDGSASPYATGNFDFERGRYYTIFLAGQGQSARIKVFNDDMSVPASGQVKVRFIHLSDAAPEDVDIRRGSGDNLIVDLERDEASNYVTVAPGILSLDVYATGQTTSLGNFDLTALLPDKIYTVFITGSTTADIEVQQVVHN
ncbi:DUF4397 domain-containing protein [Pedobacter immunditicola]|uniref:DUF4397 domain-containing protein n=1 Tax=Pedobacter immunditicola TaxID=3133440 RepID=UPI0030ABD321